MELLYSVAPKAASTNENLLPRGWLLDQLVGKLLTGAINTRMTLDKPT